MRIGLNALMIMAIVAWNQSVSAQENSGESGDEQEKPGSGESQVEESESDENLQELMNKGQAAVIGSDWKSCLKYFERALTLEPDDPIIYLAIGRCSLEIGENVKALKNLQKGMQKHSLSDERRSRAENLLKRARQKLGGYTIKLSPGSADIKISDEPVQLDDKDHIFLEAGRYPITVTAEGYQTVTTEIEVVGGKEGILEYNLQPIVLPESKTPSPPPSLREEKPDSKFPLLPVVLAGVGGAMLIAATVTGITALSNEQKLADECEDNVCDASLKSTRDSANTLSIVTDVLWISGVLSIGTAAVLYFFVPSEEYGSASVAPVVSPSEVGLLVRSSFGSNN